MPQRFEKKKKINKGHSALISLTLGSDDVYKAKILYLASNKS